MFYFRVIVFVLLFVVASQVPALINNYQTGVSAIIAELQSDYDKLSKIATKLGFNSVEELLQEALKTGNKAAKSIVSLMGEKIPRYLLLKSQQEILKQEDLISTVRVVFYEGDPIVRNNMWSTYKITIPLELNSTWIAIMTIFSLVGLIIVEIVFKVIFWTIMLLTKTKIFKRKQVTIGFY